MFSCALIEVLLYITCAPDMGTHAHDLEVLVHEWGTLPIHVGQMQWSGIHSTNLSLAVLAEIHGLRHRG